MSLLVQDNNQLKASIKEMEDSFTQLKDRYVGLKSVNEGYKRGEEDLRKTIATQEQDLAATGKRFDALKAHAQKKIDE